MSVLVAAQFLSATPNKTSSDMPSLVLGWIMNYWVRTLWLWVHHGTAVIYLIWSTYWIKYCSPVADALWTRQTIIRRRLLNLATLGLNRTHPSWRCPPASPRARWCSSPTFCPPPWPRPTRDGGRKSHDCRYAEQPLWLKKHVTADSAVYRKKPGFVSRHGTSWI